MAKKFYAQKDALGFPILGTMMSGTKVPNQENIIEITSSTGLGNHPEGFKYYVRKDKKGNILPNSLFVSYSPQNPGRTISLQGFSATSCIQFVANTTLGGLNFGMGIQSSEDITYTATWGDGTTSNGTIIAGEESTDVEHSYTAEDTAHSVTLCFSDPTKVTYLSFWGND
jgi:hypothetical protein